MKRARQTANWYKIAGIVLIILGIVVIIGSPIVVVTPGDENHPWETDATVFYVEVALGIALIVVGILLYYVGIKKEKGLAPVPRPPN